MVLKVVAVAVLVLAAVAGAGYLATIGSCATCHIRMERGRPIEGMAYAGGLEFKNREGRVQYSANITPDMDTGKGVWTEDMFVGRFKAVADTPESELALNGRPNTEMPWRDYGGMDDREPRRHLRLPPHVPAVNDRVPC